MSKGESFWGIDIGQCALKALRCRGGDNEGHIIAEAFDYIEYPKILSQPDADPAELIRDALDEFLKRNPVKGSHVAISVPGDRGLPRFVKLPPVESSKIPDLVKFEAKQQIPFPLEDVVWDFQQMPGGTEEDGFSMETEVGLFAMKRDQVFRSLRPFTNAGIEVDIVQLTPIALFNYVVFDQMSDLPPPDQYDPDNPPVSQVVMSLGTDTSDLVVTNGYRMWQRSIPIGGNHFTKAITKELKVTFSKAEHLKRNAMKAEDPRAIFQAMKPVFNELVTEVQRSLNFFNSINRTAKLGKILALGNTMKLRGLQKYLAQNLGMEVVSINEFRGLSGSAVVKSPQFIENLPSFGVCYGLCIQSQDNGVLSTNLLPGEILKARMMRAKKPWAVAAAAALLIGCGVGYAGSWREFNTSLLEPYEVKGGAFDQVKTVVEDSGKFLKDFDAEQANYNRIDAAGQNLALIPERQFLWPTLFKALGECLPQAGKKPADHFSKEIGKRDQIHVATLDCEYFPELEKWFAGVKEQYLLHNPGLLKAAAKTGDDKTEPVDPAAAAPTDTAAASAEADPEIGPKGKGYVIEIRGYHFHNESAIARERGAQYVQNTLIKNMENQKIVIKRLNGKSETVTLKQLGVEYPVIVSKFSLIQDVMVPNPQATSVNPMGNPLPPAPVPVAPPVPSPNGALPPPPLAAAVFEVPAKKYAFVLQFAWRPLTESERDAAEQERIVKVNKEKAEATANAATQPEA